MTDDAARPPLPGASPQDAPPPPAAATPAGAEPAADSATPPPPGPPRPGEGPAGPPPGAGQQPPPGYAPPPGASFTSRYGLVRPREGRYLAGVCAAIGRATNTDPVLWRVILAVLGFFGGIGVLVYVSAWLIIPGEGDTASPVESMLGRGRSSMSPVTVIVLGILVAVSFGYIVTDAFRAVLLGAAILVGGALLLNREDRRPVAGPGPVPPPGPPGAPPGPVPPVAWPAPAPTVAPPPVVPTAPVSGGPAAAPVTAPPAHQQAAPPEVGYPPAACAEAGHPPPAPPEVGYPPAARAEAGYPPPAPPEVGYPPAAPPEVGYPPAARAEAGYPPAAHPVPGYRPEPASPVGVPPVGPLPPAGYRPPFAPGGPWAAGPRPPAAPPAPPSKPPKRPRERSPLGAVTFSLIFLALGVVALLDLLDVFPIGAAAYFAAALTVIGLGLLVGAWFGRARWLVALGLVTAAALGVATVADSYDGVGGLEGDVTWAPTSYQELAVRYRNDLGNAVLDLRAVDFDKRETTVDVTVNLGNATVVVPPDVDVTTVAEVRAGEAVVFGERTTGPGGQPRKEVTDLGRDGPGGGRLRLVAHVNAGNLEVTR
ncbi:PspC domain-containing protein [Micromonospora siamensis]|uniref:Phage shock protein PspC (Stress-responsive transcriptional regulator) n=1 Tax=Micromonospora siamensis TaxID=299152 RepID=A0A1C5K4I8_9ACTN|nr:PspC domain-containing protein [Micromonospora siamensis]SCG77695.1 Phage shock protein PspC (stress-responsive transcriptional regulator) [Micromonospora siamensis]